MKERSMMKTDSSTEDGRKEGPTDHNYTNDK